MLCWTIGRLKLLSPKQSNYGGREGEVFSAQGGLLASGMMLLCCGLLPCSAAAWDTHPASPVLLRELLRS